MLEPVEASVAAFNVLAYTVVRGGSGFSDTGISGFLPGHDRREVHEKAKT